MIDSACRLRLIAKVVTDTNVDQRDYLITGVLRESKAARAEIVPYLIQALRDPEPRVRVAAAFVLSESTPLGESAVSALITCLQDPAPAVRQQAAWALAAAGTNATAAVPLLIKLVEDPHYSARVAAALALYKINPSEASRCVHALTEAIRDQRGDGMDYAVRGLGRIGPAASNAVPLIIPWLDDPNAWRRREAAEALGRIRDSRDPIRSKLTRLATDPDAEVAKAAGRALERVDSPSDN